MCPEDSVDMSRLLHRASLVIQGGASPLADGAVLTENGSIVAVGPYEELQGEGALVDHGVAILAPALINCHAHLELSHLEPAKNPGSFTDMTMWIRDLLARRQVMPFDLSRARIVLEEFVQQGVACIVDIGNLKDSAAINQRGNIDVYFLLEQLGLSLHGTRVGLAYLRDAEIACTAHAPYSTSRVLLAEIKKKARENQSLFSIHVAESEDELQFLLNGGGAFRRFVEERGLWDGSYQAPGCGAVHYLDDIGVLDGQTMCVHCVHVSLEEIELLAKRRAHVCLCPGSNRYLGVGSAPVVKMLEAGLLPCLGTDSAASNPVLSMWEEMKTLREDHPSLSPQTVFLMATTAGARALGATEYGELSRGKTSRFLVVEGDGATRENVFDYLTSKGQDISVQWSEEREMI